MSEITLSISENPVTGQVRTALKEKKVRLIAKSTKTGKELKLRPSEWRCKLPEGISVDGEGYLSGTFGNTAFPAGRDFHATARVDLPRCIRLGVVSVAEARKLEKEGVRYLESNRVDFRVKVTRDSTDRESNEIVGGDWSDYNHLSIRESGSTQMISNSWSMAGITSAENVVGVSNSDDAALLRTDMTLQVLRLSSTMNMVVLSSTIVGARLTSTYVGGNISRSTTNSDIQYNRTVDTRFVMVDPPVVDVEFNVMDKIGTTCGLWTHVGRTGGEKVWKDIDGSRWIQLSDTDLPDCLEALRTSAEFERHWPMMSDIRSYIPDLNATIPGLSNTLPGRRTHIPPLSANPTSVNYLRANNGSARLVIRTGFAQLFHMHSGWGRSFYFSPVTNYYLTTVRQYYDELDQTLGRQFTLVNGESHIHYRCRSKEDDDAFAGWGSTPDRTILSAYEKSVAHRIVHVPQGGAAPSTLAEFMMDQNGSTPNDGLIAMHAGSVTIADGPGTHWNALFSVAAIGPKISGLAPKGEISFEAGTGCFDVKQELHLGGAQGEILVRPVAQTIEANCPMGFTVNSQRVALAN